MATSPLPTIHDYALAALSSGNFNGYQSPRHIAEYCYTLAEHMMQQQERYVASKGKDK